MELNPKVRATRVRSLETLVPSNPPCKICGAPTLLNGCLDFGTACTRGQKAYFPLTGIPIYYHRCPACEFLFTAAFDDWSFDDFTQHIYNDDYALVDPEYFSGERQRRDSVWALGAAERFGAKRVLDYGGGSGGLAAILREHGIDATSWDPVVDGRATRPPEQSFDLITCFEVMEHTPTPTETAREMLSFLAPRGLVVLATGITVDLPPQAMDWWYIAPRNGHISIHSQASLRALFGKLGRTVLGDGPFVIK